MQCYLGLGRTRIQPAEDYIRKSVGTESTFHAISDRLELHKKLRWISEELEKDLSRTKFKGKTLVLKIKLHTYEVFTRQVAPPKAVCLADDLYNYSLPMLTKLEKEIPDFRLRLMGLRCTHLVSTKKDKGDFFGRKTNATSTDKPSTDDGWETWPDSEFEEAARQEREDEMEELERLSQEQQAQGGYIPTADWHEPFGRYKYGSEPNSPANVIAKAGHLPNSGAAPKNQHVEELWDCPICTLPQPANDQAFNSHIDLCLSRQTIKEVVAEADKPPRLQTANSTGSARASPSPETFGLASSARPASANGVKTKRKASSSSAANDLAGGRKQKKLFFT